MKKILFIVPQQSDEYPEYPHTGIGYLSEFLTKNKIDNKIIDMRLGYTIKDALNLLKKYKPDFVGITLITAKRDKGYELINSVANECSKTKCKVVIGGPHVSMISSKVLEECRADFAVKGEGEETLLELLRGKNTKKIDGLIFRNQGKIIENKDRKWLINLDKLPWPKHEKAELKKYKGGGVSIVTSRGCPYQCIYCSAKLVAGQCFRVRSPENILEELEYWNQNKINYFHIVDDNFTLNKERVVELCNLILKNKITSTFACDGVRADRVDYETLKKMKQAGFKYLSFGVEGGNNKVLQAIKKGETIEQIKKAIEDSIKLGFEVYLFFLVGSPTETQKDVEDSIALALKYSIAGVNFYNLVPFPGTELYDYVEKNNLFLIKPEQYLKDAPYYSNTPVFETPEFPKKQRIRMLKKTKEIRQKIKRRVLKQRLEKLGLLGKISYPLLRFEFVKDVLVGKFLVKIPLLRKFIKRKTIEAFTH